MIFIYRYVGPILELSGENLFATLQEEFIGRIKSSVYVLMKTLKVESGLYT